MFDSYNTYTKNCTFDKRRQVFMTRRPTQPVNRNNKKAKLFFVCVILKARDLVPGHASPTPWVGPGDGQEAPTSNRV